MSRTRVLLLTHDKLGDRMAGPAIRVWELGRQLGRSCDVTVASKLPVERSSTEFAVRSFERDGRQLRRLASGADVIVVQGLMLASYPFLARVARHLVVDLYDPFLFEAYPYFEAQGSRRDATFMEFTGILADQLLAGDYFLCASERQRDLWLGALSVLGRLSPGEFSRDPAMRHVIDLVPFGIPDEEPAAGDPVLRGVLPGIGPDDFVLLWGGGIYDWFDPLTVIHAVAALAGRGRPVRLVFLGTDHPNPEVSRGGMGARAEALARDLGILDSHVFFVRGWVPYERRQAYLLEADAGVTAHFDTIETRFAFRTRVLDYLWAGLPILTTDGDDFARLVEDQGLGNVISPGDVDGWAEAIGRVAAGDRAEVRARVRAAAAEFRWSRASRPLVRFCEAPWSPTGSSRPRSAPPGFQLRRGRTLANIGSLVGRGFEVLRTEGSRGLLARGLERLTRNQAER